MPTPTQWEIYIEQIQSMIDGLESQIPTKYSELTNDNYTVQDENYVHTDNNFTNTLKTDVENNTTARHTHANKSVLDEISSEDISNWDSKQDALVSGTNIKTINNESILGSGNIEIQGGGSSDYTDLTNKPSINNVTLSGNKSLNDLGIINFSGNYNDLTNKPTIPSEVTETTVSNWGFTKNTGTITSVKMNGSTIATSGEANLGTVITQHQDISGKLDVSKVKNTYSTTSGDVYDVTYINTTVGNIETLLGGI